MNHYHLIEIVVFKSMDILEKVVLTILDKYLF